MQLGMIGLGRMGANIVRRLMRDGHECVVYDVNEAAIAQLEGEGAVGARSLEELVAAARRPRGPPGSWCPPRSRARRSRSSPASSSAATSSSTAATAITATTSTARASSLPGGIHYVDVGTSGGVFGLERGYCLMIGGENETVQHLEPIFRTLAPGVEMAARTPGRARRPERSRSTATCTAAATARGTS